MPMATHVLLLRGINLGPTTQIAMADLRDLLVELGYPDVRTHLRSGNVALTSFDTAPEQLAQRVEDAVANRLDLKLRVIVRTRDELAAIIAANPLPAAVADPARFLVTFFSGVPDPTRVDAVDPRSFEPDTFRILGREMYQWSPSGVSKTKLTPAFWAKQQLGVDGTARNWNTVTALMRILDD